MKKNSAFTLVELAITIVVIGLLVGGIVIGKELVKQAKIQTILKNLESYKTATFSYKNKYGDLPGDSTKHAQFFPSAGITEGNGDMQIDQNSEIFEYWRAMSLAKMITGTYTGWQGSILIDDGTVPKDTSNLSYIYKCIPALPGSFSPYLKSSCWYFITTFNPSMTSTNSGYGAFSTQDMQSIDIKYDDGNPASGKILAIRTSATPIAGVCTDNNASDGTSGTANYISSDTENIDCQPMFEFIP